MYGCLMASTVMGAYKSASLAREAENAAIDDAVSGLPEGDRAEAAYRLRCERDIANSAMREARAKERMAQVQESSGPSSGSVAMAGVLGFIFGSAIN